MLVAIGIWNLHSTLVIRRGREVSKSWRLLWARLRLVGTLESSTSLFSQSAVGSRAAQPERRRVKGASHATTPSSVARVVQSPVKL
jgi:hypothetical protein